MTMKVPAEFKRLIMENADAYGMTMTEFIKMVVERDGS
jgi:antitoxin component of RelBE/YafQ-DinJ toxin-antitoxin module